MDKYLSPNCPLFGGSTVYKNVWIIADLLFVPYTANRLDRESGEWVVGKECREHKPVVEIVLLQILLRKGGEVRNRMRKG